MFIGRVFVHPTSGMSGATASLPVCAVPGMLFFAAFTTLVVIAIVACVMAAFDRDMDRLCSTPPLSWPSWPSCWPSHGAWWADRRIRTYQTAFTSSAILRIYPSTDPHSCRSTQSPRLWTPFSSYDWISAVSPSNQISV